MRKKSTEHLYNTHRQKVLYVNLPSLVGKNQQSEESNDKATNIEIRAHFMTRKKYPRVVDNWRKVLDEKIRKRMNQGNALSNRVVIHHY